jgi:hypothetical protein
MHILILCDSMKPISFITFEFSIQGQTINVYPTPFSHSTFLIRDIFFHTLVYAFTAPHHIDLDAQVRSQLSVVRFHQPLLSPLLTR